MVCDRIKNDGDDFYLATGLSEWIAKPDKVETIDTPTYIHIYMYIYLNLDLYESYAS